jgi:hypothetical protein
MNPMHSSGREISGDFTMADAMHVPREVVRDEYFLSAYARRLLACGQPFVCRDIGVYDAHLTYVRCERDDNRPFNHVGDWPEQGQWYATRPVNSRADGIPGIRIMGFSANAPYFNSYAIDRFGPNQVEGSEFVQLIPHLSLH